MQSEAIARARRLLIEVGRCGCGQDDCVLGILEAVVHEATDLHVALFAARMPDSIPEKSPLERAGDRLAATCLRHLHSMPQSVVSALEEYEHARG